MERWRRRSQQTIWSTPGAAPSTPATAANFAYLLFCIENAEDITARKRKPDELAVYALNDFKLQVDLRAPTPFFLQLVSSRIFCAVPRRSIEANEPSWTEPGRLVSSGAFKLTDRRPNEHIVLTRNPYYYEANLVTLTELIFRYRHRRVGKRESI